MIGVVTSEGNSWRKSHRNVTDDRQNFIVGHVAASAKMHEIVNAAMKSMAKETSDDVTIEKNEPERHILLKFKTTLVR